MFDYNNLKKITKNIFKRELAWVWIFGFALSLIIVTLFTKNKLPLGKGDFIFVFLLTLLISLYRPRWIFFLFVASISFENIILTGNYFPIQLRPYQLLEAVLIIAVCILFISKKLQFKLIKLNYVDWAIFSLPTFSFLALVSAPNKLLTLKQDLILVSFAALYYLVRNFIRSREDLAKTAAFFAIPFLMTILFGFYQVLADKFGAKSFEVMFGRPNSTFAEPDWLGIFLCFALAALLSLMFYFIHSKQKILISKKYILTILDIFVLLNITLIILTLSRSVWVGTGIIIVFYIFLNLPKPHISAIAGLCGQSWKLFFRETFIIISILLISIISVHFSKLSKFNLSDRARSTATSKQEITVACDSNFNVPTFVPNIDELSKYNCRHINLEEINYYKSLGKFVTEIYRKDPNVLARGTIYQKSWEIIKTHPILGVGFGTVTQKLGVDQRGAGLNESNIFLQIWAGSGILGLIAFVLVTGYLFIYSFRHISPVCLLNKIVGYPAAKAVKDDYKRAANVFIVLGIAALIIPNLFNAGLLMAVLWLGLATFVSIKDI